MAQIVRVKLRIRFIEHPSPHRPSVGHLTKAPQQHQHTAARTPTQVQKFRGNSSRSRPLIQIRWLSVGTNQKSGYQPEAQRNSLNSTIRKLIDLPKISCCSCLYTQNKSGILAALSPLHAFVQTTKTENKNL